MSITAPAIGPLDSIPASSFIALAATSTYFNYSYYQKGGAYVSASLVSMWDWWVVAGWVAGCSLSVSLGPLAVCLAPRVALVVSLFGCWWVLHQGWF